MKIELSGKVASGRGEGRKYVELPWVQEQMSEKLGFNPYLGTLNLILDEENTESRKLLEKNAALKVCPAIGYCTGLLFKASVAGLECGVVVPQVDNYPENLLEVVASVNLRQKLGVTDGDEVKLTVYL